MNYKERVSYVYICDLERSLKKQKKMCGTKGQYTQSHYVTYENLEFYCCKLREIKVCRECNGVSCTEKINILSRSLIEINAKQKKCRKTSATPGI